MTRRLSQFGAVAFGVTIVLTAGGCQSMRHFADVISGNTANKAAAKMVDAHFPDERREGILYLVNRDYGRRDPFTEYYQTVALQDEDYTVRAMAIRALNISRHQPATGTFIKALSDREALVRMEAAKALANLPDPAAQERLLQIVADERENRDVRIAAADALKHYKNISVGRTLVNQLGGRDFSVSWQARRSLRTLTGADHKYNQAAWLTYMTGPESPFR
jgi:hypothetical protein